MSQRRKNPRDLEVNMDLLEKIKKVDWQYLVSREEALLFFSITVHSYRDFSKVTGLPWHATLVLYCGQGEFFHSAKELDELRSIFRKGSIDLFLDLQRQLIYHVKNLDKLSRQIEKIDCFKLTKKELLNLLKKYYRVALDAHKFLLPMPVADGVLSKMILGQLPKATENEKQKWLGILIPPLNENEHIKEERSFYRLARVYKNKDKNFSRLLQNHLKRFAVIGARGYWFNRAWTVADIKDRLENFFVQRKNPEKELKHLAAIRKERETATQELLNKLKIKKSSPLFKLIQLAQDFAYFRTWRTDILYGAGYRAHNLFDEVARRAGFKGNVSYLIFEELIKMAETSKSPISIQEFKKRKEHATSLLLKGKHTILSGRIWQRKIKKIIESMTDSGGTVKGNTAFSGKVRGLVKVVLTSEEIKKVKRGDILVAVMTFPHFIAAMEKASAFVTDEGGILCHAAIVAREMNKPCIIATKIATKVLKDGDEVEVDANKGMVRILKK